MTKLSIIIPVYNERNTVLRMLKLVQEAPLQGAEILEIIMIDDCSTDGTRELLQGISDPLISIIYKEKNSGKGACLQIGFEKARGDIVIIQDADLEYDPSDYQKMIDPIIEGRADVVYGSRFIGGRPKSALFFWHSAANRWLSVLSNIFTNLNLTDMATCYKVFSKKQVNRFRGKLTSKRFTIDEELTAWVGHGRAHVYEVGISYNGRSYEEGKKINWKDGIAALWAILWFNVIAPRSFVERRVTRGWGPLDRILTIWRSAQARNLLYSIASRNRILDIGCGSYPYFLKTIDFKEKYGLDQHAINEVSGVSMQTHNFEQGSLPFPDHYFDAVTMLAVIEHLSESSAINIVAESKRVLKTNGVLVITTPSAGADQLLRVLAALRIISREEINDHKQFYTKELLRNHFVKAGWEEQSVQLGSFEFGYNLFVKAIK